MIARRMQPLHRVCLCVCMCVRVLSLSVCLARRFPLWLFVSSSNRLQIPFYTLPPTRPAADTGGLQIAQGWAKEFDLSLIDAAQKATLEAASKEDSDDFVAIPAAHR